MNYRDRNINKQIRKKSIKFRRYNRRYKNIITKKLSKKNKKKDCKI